MHLHDNNVLYNKNIEWTQIIRLHIHGAKKLLASVAKMLSVLFIMLHKCFCINDLSKCSHFKQTSL